ncbi:MAG: hypothetical protein LAO30_10715 [Acidobacteriia bacterium]|nr:hypothetical protein [Terriglobia bacterium]
MIDPTTLRHRIAENPGGVGVSVVFKAEGKELHHSVSLKFTPLQVPEEPQALERSRRDPLATSAFNQPNLNPDRGGSAWV